MIQLKFNNGLEVVRVLFLNNYESLSQTAYTQIITNEKILLIDI